MEHHALLDICHACNLDKRDYMYFSSHHNFYSTIDLILDSHTIDLKIRSATIEPWLYLVWVLSEVPMTAANIKMKNHFLGNGLGNLPLSKVRFFCRLL